jgi:hypothetical protein
VTNVQRRFAIVTSLCLGFLLSGAIGTAHAQRFLPPPGQIFQGVTSKPVSQYIRAVGKHPAVYQEFVAWGQYLPGITQDAIAVRARMMIHITTGYGSSEAITPGGIASGRGDAWLIGLQQAIFASHNITYIRLMAEMNNANNYYCAFNADGSRRDAAHSTAQFKRAWKRVTLIMRGGSLTRIDAQLHRLGMPPLRTHHDLPTPRSRCSGSRWSAGAPTCPAMRRTTIGRAVATSTGSGPTSTRSSPTGRGSSSSTACTRTSRSCSGSTRYGAGMIQAGSTSCSAGSALIPAPRW